MTQEEIEKTLIKTFNAGREYQKGEYSEYNGGHEHDKPGCFEFVNGIFKEIVFLNIESKIELLQNISTAFSIMSERPEVGQDNKLGIKGCIIYVNYKLEQLKSELSKIEKE